MFMRSCLAVLAASFSISAATAATPADSTIAREAQSALEQVSAVDGPGAAVLIAKGDHVIFRAARGRANIELGTPLATDQVFQIASVTKMFTAATVLKLAALGQLSIDDPLATYLPDFPHASGITLRQLLNHTAGISDIAKDLQPGFSRRDVDMATLIAEISKRPPDFAPGTRWAYSNAGYILLGAVIEKVTGEPWYTAMQKQLLDPLGLKQTRYGARDALIPGRVAGYSTDSQTHRVSNASFISLSIPASAGALVSTVDDLHRWMRALATGKAIGNDGFQQMISATPDLPGSSAAHRYGFGTYLWHVRGNLMVGHTGQINGFASVVAYLPKQDITVVALGNDDEFDARTLGRRLAAIALGEPYAEVNAVPFSDDILQSLAGTYRLDETTIETLSVKQHTLYAQRGKRNLIPMQMTADQRIYFTPDEISYFVPVRDASGKVVGLDYFDNGEGPAQRLPRVSTTGGMH
ncbi:serine hydrolase domain-containing protein [Dyella silvatica]|uniref:serine hydrolase domain-containing protein n=1 Tax=Dyella silvatica TaxID=2992128 RepID=UPI002255D938|nr:serine hydrolase domain-containing protein [Dyella silvatica]